uniref:Uncharacterized protein n=1 Tax=Romanomermis culicivorax TaxID=13658 RepID=A0A915JWB2_ROMCU
VGGGSNTATFLSFHQLNLLPKITNFNDFCGQEWVPRVLGYVVMDNGTEKINRNDHIAVLQLKYSMEYDDHIKPLPLSKIEIKNKTEDCYVSGRGPDSKIKPDELTLDTVHIKTFYFDDVKLQRYVAATEAEQWLTEKQGFSPPSRLLRAGAEISSMLFCAEAVI